MPKFLSRLFTPARIAKLKLKLKAYALIFGVFYFFYRFVFYKMSLGIVVRDFIAYIMDDPIQSIATLIVVYLLLRLASKIWWWAIFL